MSDFISKIEYILDPKEFADKVNESTNKIFCLLFYESPKLTATDNNLTERLVLEKFDNFDVSAIYSDVILVDNDLHSPQLYPSYFPNLLNSGLIIQSPIFVCSKPGLTLTYNSNLKVFYGHDYLRQVGRRYHIMHIPETLYSIVINKEDILNIQEDLRILNE